MCGILGIISRAPNEMLTAEAVIKMRDTMTARGPDEAGYFRERNFVLAHRRLSIRDLDHGQQPWVSQNGRFVLVYNGELYNDRELTVELANQGIQLRTRCDTEVIAEAWAVWGEACLEKLRGMFAFAVVERETGDLWLVRDRFGIKPLYYANVGSDFVFASSVSAIRQHPGFRARPNLAVLAHYLQTLRITLGNETCFEGVNCLRPAELLFRRDCLIHRRKYWQIPFGGDDLSERDYSDAIGVVEKELRDSVTRHLVSDVPVGLMLSGGVDSNTLASLTTQEHSASMLGVCGGGQIEQPSQIQDDFHFAADCARQLGIEFDEAKLDHEGYLENWEHLIGANSLPLATPTDAVIFEIAKRLKQDAGVAVGGEGADELFCGYEIQHWSPMDFDRSFRLDEMPSSLADRARQELVQQYGRHEFGSLADHYLSFNSLIPLSVQEKLFRGGLTASMASEKIRAEYQSRFDSFEGRSNFQKYQGMLQEVNLESLLSRLDSSTMAASLEARVPFADHVLAETVYRLPREYKIHAGSTHDSRWQSSSSLSRNGTLKSKRILRELASHWLPDRLAFRPKQSFPTPVASWCGGAWRKWIQSKLESPFARSIFRADALEELAKLPQPLAMWNWPIMNVILWGEKCFDS